MSSILKNADNTDEIASWLAPKILFNKLNYYFNGLIKSVHLKYSVANLLCGCFPNFVSGVIRGRLYYLAGFKIGSGSFIMGNLALPGSSNNFYNNLKIGKGVVIGDHVTINLDANVFLGNHVSIGPQVLIYTATHQIGYGSNRRSPVTLAKPVIIEEGSWIGLAAIILPGVTIGHGSVIGAGAVVSKDVPPNSYVEGNPGKVIYQLPWGDR